VSPARKAADEHARVAQTVIERHYGPWPLKYAVQSVVGDVPTSTITARRFSGTTWHGQLVLAITVKGGGEFSTDYTRCYAYRFDHFQHHGGDSVSGMGECPSDEPMNLPRIPPEPFSETGVARLERRLDALPNPRTVARVRAVTARTFPPPATVTARPEGEGIGVLVLLETDCVKGDVPVAGPGRATLRVVISDSPDCGA
jgi:hypothetical protein